MATKILVVDDESDLEFLVNAKFKKWINEGEFQFVYARNGEDGLKSLEENPDIDIIVTDINMPVMDGMKFLKSLPLLKRNYKAVVISAYGDISNIRMAMNWGASDFIMKPINFDDFRMTLIKMREEVTRLNAATLAESYLKEIQIELEIAKSIQESMLPTNFTPFPDKNLDIAGIMLPAKQVGGDFFDVFSIGKKKLAMVIADVSGKNISACLYMAIARALIRAFCDEQITCSDVFDRVDRYLSTDNTYCMFVTAFFAILDIETGQLICCNAGHVKPYVLGSDKCITEIPVTAGHPLGLELEVQPEISKYDQVEIMLKPGDTLFFYTDGVTEAMNVAGDIWGEERLKTTLLRLVNTSAKETIAGVMHDIHAYTTGAIQNDDITILVVSIK